MNSLLDDYTDLMNELLRKRQESLVELSVEVESDYAEKLDEIWWKLTDSEQDFLEKKFGKHV